MYEVFGLYEISVAETITYVEALKKAESMEKRPNKK